MNLSLLGELGMSSFLPALLWKSWLITGQVGEIILSLAFGLQAAIPD